MDGWMERGGWGRERPANARTPTNAAGASKKQRKEGAGPAGRLSVSLSDTSAETAGTQSRVVQVKRLCRTHVRPLFRRVRVPSPRMRGR
jgi:hypothetical protein